jgi:hypothetical protein
MNILGKILEAVLKPKFEKEANKIINSEEVQSNLKVISHSTNEIITWLHYYGTPFFFPEEGQNYGLDFIFIL